jgi:hypothetical protein
MMYEPLISIVSAIQQSTLSSFDIIDKRNYMTKWRRRLVNSNAIFA